PQRPQDHAAERASQECGGESAECENRRPIAGVREENVIQGDGSKIGINSEIVPFGDISQGGCRGGATDRTFVLDDYSARRRLIVHLPHPAESACRARESGFERCSSMITFDS